MRSAILGFAVGIAWLQQQATLANWLTVMGLMWLAAMLLLGSAFMAWRPLKISTLLIAGALFGWTWASSVAIIALEDRLPVEYEEKEIAVIGVITSLPSRSELGQRFQFSIEKVVTASIDETKLPKRVLLSWFDVKGQINESKRLRPGERWQLTVKLKRPHGLANPHGFDYEVWLLEQGIGATGNVKSDSQNHRIDAFVLNVNNAIQWARGQLREKILAALPNQPYAPVIVALVIGEQNAITHDDWQIFARTGVSHLIAISGLHVTLLSGMIASLMYFLWRRSFWTRWQLPLIMPAQKVAAVSGVLTALVYVALAGFGIPAQRTLLMVGVAALACWFDRVTSVTHVLCLALGLVLLLDPWAVLAPGFWLSFGAVGLLFYISLGRHELKTPEQALTVTQQASSLSIKEKIMRQLRQATLAQYAITIGLVPLTILLFNQVSLVSPLANAVAIPVVSFLVTPLALIGSVLPDPLAAWVLHGANWILLTLIAFLAWLSEFSWAVWQAPRPHAWMFIAALAGTAWCLAPRGWPLRWAGLLAWLPLCLHTSEHPPNNEFNVVALDVGQGMALLVETEHHRLLYDAGPLYSSQSDAGSSVITPYLKMRGITALDGVMISHGDTDHSGGAMTILEQLKIGWVSSSLEAENNVVRTAKNRSTHTPCVAGQTWEWDGVKFEVLYPNRNAYAKADSKPNAKSCVLKVSNQHYSLLLTGDIEAKQEHALIKTIPEKLPSTVLLAPHHGSGTSSSLEFLEAVNPRMAIFQVGYRNRYRHPKLTVWERYGELGIARLRTDDSGAILLRFGQEIETLEYRKASARYWFAL